MIKTKEIIYQLLAKVKILPFVHALILFKKIEIDYGHFLSVFKMSSVDSKGEPIPWFTYPAIDYLKSIDLSRKNVFEFGSGNSTIFWAKRCKKVISVEHDKKWYEKTLSKLKELRQNQKRAELIFAPSKKNYLESIKKYKYRFDIIVIDGLYREECIKEEILKKLRPNGWIILDNSEHYPKMAKKLGKEGFTKIDFTGFGPINPYAWSTSIFLVNKIRNLG